MHAVAFRKECKNHYIILTEFNRKYEADQFGRMAILRGTSICYSVFAADDTRIKDGYIADFIMLDIMNQERRS